MKPVKTTKLCLLALALLALITACKPKGNDYSEFRNLPTEGWAYGDPLVFKPDIADSAAVGRLEIDIRHTNEYPYSNLWVELTYPGPDSLAVDTLNIELCDVYGRWHGRGIGADFQLAHTVSLSFTLVSGADISLRHIMRVDTLRHIEQIGLTFTPEQQ